MPVYIPFHLTPSDYTNDLCPVGALQPEVFDAMRDLASSGRLGDNPFHVISSNELQTGKDQRQAVCFADWVVDQGKMGEVMNEMATIWRREGKFPGPLAGMCTGVHGGRFIDLQAGGMNTIRYLPTHARLLTNPHPKAL